jgi:hypothetical protein
MRFVIKEILLCLLMLCALSMTAKAQQSNPLPTPPMTEDEDVCGLTDSDMIWTAVSVWSNRMAYLKDLTYRDFEVYFENEPQEIEFFEFEEQSNRYIIGFHEKYFLPDDRRRDVKIKVKLSKEKADEYGEMIVTQSKYDPDQN